MSFRDIPKTEIILNDPKLTHIPLPLRTELTREVLSLIREKLSQNEAQNLSIEAIADQVLQKFDELISPSLITLINATGVVAHTNLGRSPLSSELIDEIKPLLTNYSNLEYEIAEGKRGERYVHLEKLLCKVLGAEAALVVNNNASAVFLVLNTFAKNKEAVVSRGELVEIGGSFRIPEVMRESGAILHEIGTTNKTHLRDYQNAINENTAMLMKVHRSNFSITGFVKEVSFAEIAKLADENGLIDYYDLGSGQLADLALSDQELLADIASISPSLVSFSGDKLFGSAQAGIIFGKRTLIEKLKQNQLLRMLRVDKFTLATIEATLIRYMTDRLDEIPTIKMIRDKKEALEMRASKINSLLKTPLEIVKTTNLVGAGALPEERLDGVALLIRGDAKLLHQKFRTSGLIARVEKDGLLIEMRTIFDSQIEKVAKIIEKI